MTKRKKATRPEYAEQAALVRWFRLQYPHLRRLLIANLNGAKLAPVTGRAFAHLSEVARRGIAWSRLEEQGAVKGAADLFLSIPSGIYAGLYIEMKTEVGVQSPEQKTFEADVVANGFGYCVPKGFDEAKRVVLSYLETGEY
jgi:hypothetical protein